MFEIWGSQNRTGNEQREKCGIKQEQKTVREPRETGVHDFLYI